jgi:PPP family 3-phenylpropionic acid transporter
MGLLAHRIGGLRGMLLALAVARHRHDGRVPALLHLLALLLVGLLWGCVWSPTMALYDGLLVNEAKARGFVYGTLRVWSSIAFIAGTVVCGLAVDRFGPPSVLYVGWLGIVCLLPFALALPRGEPRPRDAGRHAPFGILDLLRSRPFLCS